MFLPQRPLQMVTVLAILLSCFATLRGTENRRAVTEHQLMHDKGREFQGLKRLMWLHNALGRVHTASSRDVPLSNGMWDSQRSGDPAHTASSRDVPLSNGMWDSQRSGDPAHIASSSREEAPSPVKQLLELMEKEQGLPLLKKPDLLQYM